jgi:hypothetical protein
MVELYRAAMVDNSRLQRLDENSRAADLLELANDAEVADLIAMRDLARERLIPALPTGTVATGMTFDGSADLAADADLIAGGVLIDFKAGQGGTPRKDGTRAASLGRTDIDQLLGYTMMDYSNAFGLHSVGVYGSGSATSPPGPRRTRRAHGSPAGRPGPAADPVRAGTADPAPDLPAAPRPVGARTGLLARAALQDWALRKVGEHSYAELAAGRRGRSTVCRATGRAAAPATV